MLFNSFNTLSSNKKKVDFTRNILYKIKDEIGIKKNIKSESKEYYDFLFNLVHLHPEKETKLKRIVKDFKIKIGYLNKKAIDLFVIFENDEEDTISWNYCCHKRKNTNKQNFQSATRYCIEPQIHSFRDKNDIFKCWNCKCDLTFKYHVDQYIRFIELVDNLIKEYDVKIPLKYNKEPIAKRIIFKKEDEKLSKLFYDYHKEKAILKPSCIQCNLKRSKK